MNLDKVVNVVRYISGLPKSIYVNFRVLPFNQAIYLPIIVSRKTKLISLSGNVILDKVKPGIVRIGFGGSDNMIDYRYSRTLLKLTGTIHFKGKAKIGMGSRILVHGLLSLGNNLNITGDTLLSCSKGISIGHNCMLAFETIIMDSDQHNIYDIDGKCINESKEIVIGDDVWVGARAFILKNTKIEDGSIVSANSTLTKSFNNKNSIIGGNPNRVLKEDIKWEH
ncbi:MAG: acyltransferase [Campylobacterota bacterium]|nr:acyltransferase [Campylobacterota bacterium]